MGDELGDPSRGKVMLNGRGISPILKSIECGSDVLLLTQIL